MEETVSLLTPQPPATCLPPLGTTEAAVNGGGGAMVVAEAATTPASGGQASFEKKKRGRPRKYDANGNLTTSYQKHQSASAFSFKKSKPKQLPQIFASFGEFPSLYQ